MDEDAADLWQRIVSREALQEAWYRVRANNGCSGGDSVTIADFGADLFANLTQLRADLLRGTYRSGPVRKLSVPKKKPGYRILTIPTVRDRVVHTSMANTLTPIFEPLFEDGSFGYRPNRGVVHAVQRIETWRKRGYDVVIEADIVSYFDNIDHEILLSKVSAILTSYPGAAPLLALLAGVLKDQALALRTLARGLAQGSPLSPLLANLYLDALDEEIERQGVKIVRFADDFVILCKSAKKAETVLAHTVRVLEAHNLRLHEDGTKIVNFERGFDFIGYLFLRTLALKQKVDADAAPSLKTIKSVVSDEGIIELDAEGSTYDPGKRVLYLVDPAHRLTTRNRSFSVQRQDGSELIAIPYKRVGRMEISPGVEFTRSVVDLAIQADTDVALIDGFGQTRGRLGFHEGKRAGRQMAQARGVLDTAFRTEIARRLVNARIRNQRTQLARLNRDRSLPQVEKALLDMRRLLEKLASQGSVDEVLGIEGSVTATYWLALGQLLQPVGQPDFRRTRPAGDPINATINYMTAILERDIRAAIQTVGLHTGFAFLHASRDRHDGLVFDMMEPFRAPLTEGLAVYLFNARRVRPDMFAKDVRPTQINDVGRQAIIQGFEGAVAKRVNKTDGPGKLSWRAMMRHQAQRLAHAVECGDPALFMPYLMEA